MKGKETYARDISRDPRAVTRRVERVCAEVVELIGAEASVATVDVEGQACGELKASLAKRGIKSTGPAPSGPASATKLDAAVVVRKNGAVAGRITARVDVVPVRDVSCGNAEMNAVDLGVSVLWADRNLDVRTFRNGTAIAGAASVAEWQKWVEKGGPVWCHYEGDKENCKKYGKVYIMDATALGELPPGDWRIPTEEEWIELLVALGMKSDVGGLLNSDTNGPETSLEVWRKLLEGPFKGCLGGSRDKHGTFAGIGERATWAAAGVLDTVHVTGYYTPGDRDASMSIERMPAGFSVRCVRDKPMSEHQKAVKNARVEFVHEGAHYKIVRDNTTSRRILELRGSGSPTKCMWPTCHGQKGAGGSFCNSKSTKERAKS